MNDFTIEIEDRGGLDVVDGIKCTRLELRGGCPPCSPHYSSMEVEQGVMDTPADASELPPSERDDKLIGRP
jgi:hypothetical protein